MELYGLYVWNHHGWAKMLTVLSPEGVAAVRAHIDPGPDALLESRPDQLPLYRNAERGGVDGLIARYGIKVLDRSQWARKKAQLGALIWHGVGSAGAGSAADSAGE